MTDTQHDTIYVLMSRVMTEVGAIGKTGVNQQQHYNFRGIEDVMNALHPVLAKHGVFFVPDAIGREVETRETKAGGGMNVTHLHVRYTFYGPAGDSVALSVWGEASDSADKATNKALSAALKYALVQTFCIPTKDMQDADATTVEAAGSRARPPQGRQASTVDWADPSSLRADIARIGDRKGLSRDEIADLFQRSQQCDIRSAAVADLIQFREFLMTGEVRDGQAVPA